MIIKNARLLIIALLFCSCTGHPYNKDKHDIEFFLNNFIKIDFNLKTLKIDYVDLHYSDTVRLTRVEETEIIKSFEANRINEIKVNPIYATNGYLVMPPSGLKIKVFFERKLQSEMFIEYSYPKLERPAVNQEDRVINFRNTVLRILDKNVQIKKAKAIFLKYQSDNNFFDL